MDRRSEKDALGNKQSDFAGTNPDKYGDPKQADEQDNPMQDQEAQNVADSNDRLSGPETTPDKNKQHQGNS